MKNKYSENIENIAGQIFEIYEKQHLYPKVIVDLKYLNQLIEMTSKSDVKIKEKLIFLIRKMGVRIPKPIIELFNSEVL